jgi:hypothetical protein
MKKIGFLLLLGSSLAFAKISSFTEFFDLFSSNNNFNVSKNKSTYSIIGPNDLNFTFKANGLKKGNNFIKGSDRNWNFSWNLNTETDYDLSDNKVSGPNWSFSWNGACSNGNGLECRTESYGFCLKTPNWSFSVGGVTCLGSSNGDNSELQHGMFDAWDRDHNINDRNITTKIVNKQFDLTIVSLYNKDDDDNGNNQGKSCSCGCGYKIGGSISRGHHSSSFSNQGSSTNQNNVDIRYALFDNNSKTNITTDEPFYVFEKEKNVSFPKISKAYKDVSVQFKVCADYDGANYTLYPYEVCSVNGECSSNEEQTSNSPCIRKFYSSDNFAIRPDHFAVNVDTSKKYKAGNTISDISIKAADESNNSVDNYNELSDNLNLSAIDFNSNANIPNVDYSFIFNNGNAVINHIKYPEVGYIELNLSEKAGSEFAKIDKDDTPDTQRFITSGSSEPFKVIPNHFAITDVNVSNFNQGKYTYLSEDVESMSGIINATIIAQNESNLTTKNYSNGLYAQDVNITIPFTTSENVDFNVLSTYGKDIIENNISDGSISLTVGKENFINGEFNLSLKINFDRNVSKPVNDFNLTLDSLNVVDEDEAEGSTNLDNDNNITFRYGKITTENVSTYSNSAVVPVHYYYYHNNEWVIDKDHTKTDGYTHNVYTTDLIHVINMNENSISNGNQTIDVDTSNVVSRPYKATLHLNIDSWLWYSKRGETYQAPSELNRDCATHPCSNILINKIPKSGWRGVKNNSAYDVNTNTVDMNRSNDNNNSKKDIYYKINW